MEIQLKQGEYELIYVKDPNSNNGTNLNGREIAIHVTNGPYGLRVELYAPSNVNNLTLTERVPSRIEVVQYDTTDVAKEFSKAYKNGNIETFFRKFPKERK